MAMMPDELTKAICAAVDLDPDTVRSMDVRLRPGQPVTVEAEVYGDDRLTTAFKQYKLGGGGATTVRPVFDCRGPDPETVLRIVRDALARGGFR
jgi:hypothetical protein